MTKTGIRRLLLLSGTTALASFGATGTANAQAAAGTTLAGTQITNKANASYTVNGTAATAESNIASFVVDRKVNLSVVGEPNINTQVNLGQTNAVLTFRVTNNTNSIQDMLLRANQNLGAGGTGVDNYDVNNVRVFVDSNGNGQYDANVDVGTYIDELGIDQSAIVFIVADVPSNVPTANFATVSLNATVAAGGGVNVEGAALIPATDLNLLTQNADLDVVFADNDSDGLLGADAARNGQARAYLEYEVGARAVNLTVSKSSMVISDGVNLINPLASSTVPASHWSKSCGSSSTSDRLSCRSGPSLGSGLCMRRISSWLSALMVMRVYVSFTSSSGPCQRFHSPASPMGRPSADANFHGT